MTARCMPYAEEIGGLTCWTTTRDSTGKPDATQIQGLNFSTSNGENGYELREIMRKFEGTVHIFGDKEFHIDAQGTGPGRRHRNRQRRVVGETTCSALGRLDFPHDEEKKTS